MKRQHAPFVLLFISLVLVGIAIYAFVVHMTSLCLFDGIAAVLGLAFLLLWKYAMNNSAVCEACGKYFLKQHGYYETEGIAYSYCSDCCHW